ncbi:hydroxyacid dehydrogenase [Streptomyces sp. NPDC006733]|uniref:hydroxyacid dehydrogenase n=1 Tax=Streptomyces sp. NPDC006733 TaxID=3155460 RepID=UPI0033DC6A76
MSAETRDSVLDAAALRRLERTALIDTGLLAVDLSPRDDRLAAALREAEVLFTGWGCPPLTPAVLAAMPRLRAVVHAAGSVKGHLTQAAWDRGITVSTAARANALPVAEYTLAAILFANKRVLAGADAYRRTRDRVRLLDQFPAVGNYRRTIGVVGASAVGRRVIELLRPFDLTVLVQDPYLDPAGAAALGATLVGLDDLVRRSDVVSIHAPELPETRGLFDAARIALMRDGATLVNTARGSLVDTGALTAELVSGRLHAVLDITAPDILPAGSPLYDLPNVLLTPHMAGSLGGELRRLADTAIDELERYAQGLPFAYPVHAAALAHSA